MIIHCEKCGHELIIRDENSKNIKDTKKFRCPFCSKEYSYKDFKNLHDIEMMNEDMEIWRKAQKFK